VCHEIAAPALRCRLAMTTNLQASEPKEER
jgi:hypothetical protein